MILKPTELTPNNNTYCADEAVTISWKNNGDIMTSYSINVKDNSTGVITYSSGLVKSNITKHVIPADTLENEKEYCYTITVYNAVNNSIISDAVIFRTSAKPVVTIPNDGYVRNQFLTVKAEYTQPSDVAIKSYKFILYDIAENILEESDSFLDDKLIYTFKYQLVDGETYKVECTAVSQKDISGSSGKITLTADYNSLESYSNLQAETFSDKPYVKLQWSITRIIGEADKEFDYIEGEKADLTNGSVVSFDNNFSVGDDFTLKLWVEKLRDDIDIVNISGTNGALNIRFKDDRIHVYKAFSSLTYHTASDKINPRVTKDTKLYICIQQIENRINVYCEVI
ncbi:hypothetical protein [Abyssisolibacter fermentans]|uniref:hypothetical protein n=1 Tax=Abyssisolibacter fermentans TaxID=1766203 RepID=UPI00082AEFDB|nr:hypothetical protein [Abyssisolibacter fermentans]